MPVLNTDIARIFTRIADLLEIQGANPFRIRAYRAAARTVSDQPQSVAAMLKEGKDLGELPGIGRDLAGKIEEIVETGTLAMLKELEKEIPGELAELLSLSQLGPKKAAILHRELGVRNLQDLGEAAGSGKIRDLRGFSEKSEKKILEEIKRFTGAEKRIKLAEAEQIVRPLVEYLERIEGVKDVVTAGSFRRRRETVGDLDILVTCESGPAVMDRFVAYEDVREVLARGETKSTVLLRSRFQVDLRVVPQVAFGAALHYFTGSKDHNVAIRTIGVKKGLKISEYGIFQGEGEKEKRVGGQTEEEVFAAVGLPYIAPELRENRGEIEAAREGKLPRLVALEDIRGDLHAHTRETDGRSTLEEMAVAARALGYGYFAITEHSRSVTIARGLDPKRLERQIEAIDRLADRYPDFRILKGIELDILEDGSLDLPDHVLARLDLRVCSVHSRFTLSAEKQTERIIRAMDNPLFNILGHPTGRLIGEREPYAVDMEKIVAAAAERGCFLELNAHPDRLDLTDFHCRMARDMGVKVVISTDAHYTEDFKFMRFGIDQARRGWLEKDDVLNTRELDDLLALLKRS
jgi:DNA polymerase (family 10)